MALVEHGKKVWAAISHFLQAKELWLLLGGSGMAAGVAAIANAIEAGALVALFSTIAAFAGGGLIASESLDRLQKRRYRLARPRTWLEVYGGPELVVAVRHAGLPAKVRVRVQMREMDRRLPQHLEPCDLHLQTRPYGGTYRSIQVSDDFDLAKTTLASVHFQSGGSYSSYVKIYLPGTEDIGCSVDRRDRARFVFDATLFVATPLGVVDNQQQTYEAIASGDSISVSRLSASHTAAPWPSQGA